MANTFDTVLDEVESLPLDSQIELLEILQKRVTEQRRTNIVRDVKKANAEYKAGKGVVSTPDDILTVILG